MTYAELIRELFAQSGLETIAEYADAIGVSRTHLSNVFNDKQPGSIKILGACLAKAGKEDALRFEDDDPLKREEADALRLFRSLDERRRALALETLTAYREAVRAKRSNHK